MEDFTIFTGKPTSEFLNAVRNAGITVRCCEQPDHLFRRRRSFEHSLKTERGWMKPCDASIWYLRLTANDRYTAHDVVAELGDAHGVSVTIGAKMLGQ
jgi:hypothetical protein